MKKVLKKVGIALLIGFVGIQFIPTELNQSDEVLTSDFVQLFDAPENISNLLGTSCYDCHSNNTKYPWYNRIQPITVILQSHINEGKEELNLSLFGELSSRRQKSKLKSIISHIKNGEMPLSSYTMIHRDAILSDENKNELEEWLTSVKDNL